MTDMPDWWVDQPKILDNLSRRVPSTMIDSLPHGGHDLTQLPDTDDAEDYIYECFGCRGRVAGALLDDNTWQLVIGGWCPAILMKEGR